MLAFVLAASLAAQQIPALPDSAGWGVHVLAIARAPDSTVWVGTYGDGIMVLRPHATAWERIRVSRDTAAHAISFDFVHAFAFGPKGQVWYGTVGNGWGLSTDGGKTWRNWELGQLGPEWQYVAPNGIVTRGDTTYIGTADGIKLTFDDGATWYEITDSAQAPRVKNLWGRIGSQYVQMLAGGRLLMVKHPKGVEQSVDGGRTWCALNSRTRTPLCMTDDVHRRGDYGAPRGVPEAAGLRSARADLIAVEGAGAPQAAAPARFKQTLFQRPIALSDQPYIDQTYRYGSTMGGYFQQHQGVEFNNPDGTPVHAIGEGVVVYAGPAERGALTVAIRHDRGLELGTTGQAPDTGHRFLFSVYYHNSKLIAQVGQHVKAGDVISLVGNTGRATNDHLHLEVHPVPYDSTALVVDPEQRYPAYTTNPELWIEPLPGTGVVAGQVWDSHGQPVKQARIYGLVKPEPQETPFSYIETYGERAHGTPTYHDHFAIGDVPPGEYTLGVEIEGKRVYRRIRVEGRKLTWVEFRPDAH